MTNNDMVSNIYIGWFIGGFTLCLIIFTILQIGINIGIRMTLNLLEHEYPAAFKFLDKNKQVARVLPYVIGGE